MRSSILRLVLVALTITALAVVISQDGRGSGSAQAKHTAPAEQKLRHGCHRYSSRADVKRYFANVYRRTTISMAARKRMRLMTKCQPSPARERWAKRYRKRQSMKRRIRAVTPYAGPNGTRWAIPWSIVSCESHGSWSAYNGGSGARGPYQFVGWNVPWPVRTLAHKLAHHRMAARLWSGGSGRSHWAC